MSALHERAARAGLQIDWTDASGRAQRVSDDTLAGVLAALDHGEDDDMDVAFVSGDLGHPIALPGIAGRGELLFDDGERRAVDVAGALAAIDRAGYHRLEIGGRTITVAVAPPRCFAVADATPGRRLWGPAVQIAALRDERAAAFGDFGTLAAAAAAFGTAGADAMAISPVHALFPADPNRYSPYAPSSRLFLNILYADPGLVGMPIADEVAPALIDWPGAIPQRLAALGRAFAGRNEAIRDAVAGFVEQGGDELVRHARFDALHARFFGDGARGWQAWPAAYHDPAGGAVAAFAREHGDAVDFHLFCQWLADRSLGEAQRRAKDAGMALGLIADLAVGMDAGGSHAWSRPDDLLTGLSIGAPPDLLGPDGQNWGITGFSPGALRRSGFAAFISTIRAALAHAGGIRIDHAMGLQRLWVIPDGRSASEGAYLSYPVDDMLRVLAIESQVARAIVIGEDLGTVPEGFRHRTGARGMLGMRVMPFEAEGDRLIPPYRYDAQAAAMTGTHDLATIAGWWQGRDIALAGELGRTPDRDRAEAERTHERTRWWASFADAGLTQGGQPPPADPAPVVAAALAFVGATPSAIAIVPMEDVVGLVDQPNLPGTTTEHPNWRRRMPGDTAALLARADVAARVATINQARTA